MSRALVRATLHIRLAEGKTCMLAVSRTPLRCEPCKTNLYYKLLIIWPAIRSLQTSGMITAITQLWSQVCLNLTHNWHSRTPKAEAQSQVKPDISGRRCPIPIPIPITCSTIAMVSIIKIQVLIYNIRDQSVCRNLSLYVCLLCWFSGFGAKS